MRCSYRDHKVFLLNDVATFIQEVIEKLSLVKFDSEGHEISRRATTMLVGFYYLSGELLIVHGK